MAQGRHAELDGHRRVGRGGHDTAVHRGAADSQGAGHGREDSPGGPAGPGLAGDLDEHRRGSNLASQLLLAAGPGGELQQACQGLLASGSPGGRALAGEQPLGAVGIQSAASPAAGTN